MRRDSNAVLTPELNNPKVFETRVKVPTLGRKLRSNQASKLPRLTFKDKQIREQWKQKQAAILAKIQSNALLVVNYE